jgi:hypothetical protein
MLTVVLGQDPYTFYDGETSLNEAVPFTVRLDGRTYGVDLRNYRRSSLATLRDSVVSTGQVDDSLFNTDGAWWRYRRNWHAGAGQRIMDLGESRDSRRFDTSVGVDVWTEGQLTLLPSTELSTSDVNGSNIKLAVTAAHIYALDSTAVYRSADLVTWEQVTFTGLPQDITSDGINVYIATSSQIAKCTPASATTTSFSNHSADKIWFAAGYLLDAHDNHLHVVASNGSENLLYAHFQDSFTWTTAFAVGSKLYVGGYSGSRSELYGFTIDSSGNLVLGAEVAPFGTNELLYNAVSHVGLVLICTNKGVRLSTVGTDGSISYGPLIDDPGPVYDATAEGQYIWFTWSGIGPNKTGAGRASLAITPATLQPAYATDVYAEQSATTTAVARFNGRTVFGVAGNGVYASTTSGYVTEGTISSGNIYYGAVERKSVTDALASFDALTSGEKVTMTMLNDANEEIETVVGQQSGQTTIDVQLDGEQGNYFTTTIMLEGDGTSTPTFRYWRVRAFPVVPPVEQFVVPLILYSKSVVNDGQGQLYSIDIDEEMEYLLNAWREKRPLSYVEGEIVRRVRLEAYEYTPQDWSDSLTGFEGTMVVRLVTL